MNSCIQVSPFVSDKPAASLSYLGLDILGVSGCQQLY